MLNIVELQKMLATAVMGRKLHYYQQVASTQTVANGLIARGEGKDGTLVIAEQQTAGRGQPGRTWFSPAGTGIWLSLILKPRFPFAFTPQLTLLAAVALRRAILMSVDAPIAIKWPNDLLCNGKKICGILLESATQAHAANPVHAENFIIAGMGISANIAFQEFPEELRSKATSLLIETGCLVHRERLIADLMLQVEQLYSLVHEQGFAPVHALWEAASATIGQSIQVQTGEGPAWGIAESLAEDGALVVKLETGQTAKVYTGQLYADDAVE